MCSDTSCVALRLEGPLQSWGTASQYNRRMTDILPSRSAVMGMLCAALGLSRGSGEEKTFLHEMASVRMLAVAVPRVLDDRRLQVRRMEDYHTVQATLKASGTFKDCHITRRQFLLDASFRVFLSGGRPLMEKVGAALQDPVWGRWLGRKACIPSAPVFAGLFADERQAIAACIPGGLRECISSRDATSFAEGTDSVADMPLSFDSSDRAFALRRIRFAHGDDGEMHAS